MTWPQQTYKSKNTQIPHNTSMLAHQQEMDLTQQDNYGRTKGSDQDHHTIRTSFIFYACGAPSSHVSLLQWPSTYNIRHNHMILLPGEEHYHTSKQYGETNISKGDGPMGDGIRLRYRCSRKDAGSWGSQGERGKGLCFIGRTSVTTTIGNCLRSNKMMKRQKREYVWYCCWGSGR
jgi:hypothetical protein